MYIIALFRLLITYNAHCDKTIWRKVWQLQVDQEIPALDLQKHAIACLARASPFSLACRFAIDGNRLV